VPSAGSKEAKSPPVTLVISCNLGDPIVLARFGRASKPAFVAMPETSVNKDHFPEFRENEVRFARKVRRMEFEAITLGTNDSAYYQFRFRVLAANKRHLPAALERCQRIHEGPS
jgi:hypothetical protein